MSLSRIASYSWVALLARFGINVPPAFDLDSVVRPVVIVDSSIPISVNPVNPILGTPASLGEVLAPAANTRLADTGQLPAGNWTFTIWMAIGDPNYFRIRRRDAADVADVWSFRFISGPAVVPVMPYVFRSSMLANERIVVENVNAAGAAFYQASIFATQG